MYVLVNGSMLSEAEKITEKIIIDVENASNVRDTALVISNQYCNIALAFNDIVIAYD